jgi:hypothetical protein
MSQVSKKRKYSEINVDDFKNLKVVRRNRMSIDDRIDEYIDFFHRENRSPSCTSINKVEKSLGVWKSNMKQLALGKRQNNLVEHHIKKLLAVDPKFFEIKQQKIIDLNTLVENYCNFYLKYNRHPVKRGKIDGEIKLANWRFSERLSNKLNDEDRKKYLQLIQIFIIICYM